MLSSDDNEGAFSFLVGLIVLVMVAVSLSLLMDRRFRFSSAGAELRREIENEQAQLADLKSAIELGAAQLTENGTRRKAEDKALRHSSGKLAEMGGRRVELEKTRESLIAEIARLEEGFASYRGDYRRQARASAVGEKLGDLRTKDGREYLNATVTKVTDVGLEIRHEHGIARIQGPDLDPSFQNRFQWDDGEIRKRLGEESALLAKISAPKVPEADPVSTAKREKTRMTRDKREAVQEEVRIRQQAVRVWRGKVRTLNEERAVAEAGAASGEGSSVPGTLETWQARVARTNRELAQAKAALQIARTELAAVAPADGLLRVLPTER